MSRKLLWTALTLALALFGLVSFGPGTQAARADTGCYMTGSEGKVCNVVQVCEPSYCHYHVYVDSPPCRPAGAGPSCADAE
jgi:hypothetical protein